MLVPQALVLLVKGVSVADTKNPNPDAQTLFIPLGFEDVVLSGGVGTPHTFLGVPRAIYVGVGGIVIASVDGVHFHTFKGCPDGSYLLGAFKVVKSTADGTTATDLVGCL